MPQLSGMPSAFGTKPDLSGAGMANMAGNMAGSMAGSMGGSSGNNPMGLYSFVSRMLSNMGRGMGGGMGQGSMPTPPTNPSTNMPQVDQSAGNTGVDPNTQPNTPVPISNTPSTSNYGGGLFSAPSGGGDWMGKIINSRMHSMHRPAMPSLPSNGTM